MWDVQNADYELINVPNENYGYYKFKINSEDDIDNDKEEQLNE